MRDVNWTRRDFIRRSGITAAIAGLPILAACSRTDSGDGGAGGGGGRLESLRSEGVIKVGVANEQPYGFQQGADLTGEAPEVARAIFKALGIDRLQGVLVDSFEALIPGLQSQQYDVIAAGMFITPERCQEIAFSNPDYAGTNAFLVKRGNPKRIATFQDIADDSSIRVGVLSGAVEKGFAEDSGVKGNQIKTFRTQNEAFQGMLANRIDTVALTAISLRWTLEQQFKDEGLEVTESFVPVVDGKEQRNAGGYGFRKNDTQLLQAFNAELKKLQDSNGVLPLIQKFGFTQTEVDEAKSMAANELCSAA